jgi:hypothetical protein
VNAEPEFDFTGGLHIRVPAPDDMIALKRMGTVVRPKDEEDIQYLRVRQALIAAGRLEPDP